MGRECFESLPENELHQIYQLHQQVLIIIVRFICVRGISNILQTPCKAYLFQDLIERCKRAFQELLLEKADLFYQFRFGFINTTAVMFMT